MRGTEIQSVLSVTKSALVIGAGPAGLMAADELSARGVQVIVADAKPSPARKFLMAGKSGLNLTKDEATEDFLATYPDAPPLLRDILKGFGPAEVKSWAEELGQDVFTGSSGRVFPKTMKASPLLRAWLNRLAGAGVELKTRWRWTGFGERGHKFETPEGRQVLHPDVTVFACGGASWARLGSDGVWAGELEEQGITCVPFQPANVGFEVSWSSHMERHFGAPVKPVVLKAGSQKVRGEFVVSARGIEGSAVYAVSRAMRLGADLILDLMPDPDQPKLQQRLDRPRGKNSVTNHLRKCGLSPVKIALLREFGVGFDADDIKNLPVPVAGPRPVDEAISVAGGVGFEALDENLMLKSHPGMFCAGEMLDWEAPTGGYLITGCLATGRHTGRAAAKYLLNAGL